jgi:hypothetical protein
MEDYVDIYHHDEETVHRQVSTLSPKERDRIARLYGYPSYKRWTEALRE